MFKLLMELDGNILIWLHSVLVDSGLSPIVIFITKLGDSGAIWLFLSIALLFSKKTRQIGIMSLLALLCSFIINNLVLKNLIARIRPYDVLSGVLLLIEKQSDFSFPSGHTASSFSVAVIIFKELPLNYGIPAILLAVLIGISRLYLGVHYPSDVLCGALFGSIIAILVRQHFYLLKENGSLHIIDKWLK